jgi:hypothetical protein
VSLLAGFEAFRGYSRLVACSVVSVLGMFLAFHAQSKEWHLVALGAYALTLVAAGYMFFAVRHYLREQRKVRARRLGGESRDDSR